MYKSLIYTQETQQHQEDQALDMVLQHCLYQGQSGKADCLLISPLSLQLDAVNVLHYFQSFSPLISSTSSMQSFLLLQTLQLIS